jgi:hypothetical protein
VIIPPLLLVRQEEKVNTENVAGNGRREITGTSSGVVMSDHPLGVHSIIFLNSHKQYYKSSRVFTLSLSSGGHKIKGRPVTNRTAM